MERGVAKHVRVRRIVQTNATPFGHPQKNTIAGGGVGIVKVIRAVIVVNDQTLAAFD